MTLQELLFNCTDDDYEKIASFLTGVKVKWVQGFCDALKELVPEPSGNILIAVPSWSAGERHIGTLFCYGQELCDKIYAFQSETFPHFPKHEIEETLSSYLEAVKWALPKDRMQQYDLWEVALGATVYRENYERYGKERFLAAVLQTLSQEPYRQTGYEDLFMDDCEDIQEEFPRDTGEERMDKAGQSKENIQLFDQAYTCRDTLEELARIAPSVKKHLRTFHDIEKQAQEDVREVNWKIAYWWKTYNEEIKEAVKTLYDTFTLPYVEYSAKKCEEVAGLFGIKPASRIREWIEEPDLCAAVEVFGHASEPEEILKELGMPDEKIERLRSEYQAGGWYRRRMLHFRGPSNEEIDAAYQKMLQTKEKDHVTV